MRGAAAKRKDHRNAGTGTVYSRINAEDLEEVSIFGDTKPLAALRITSVPSHGGRFDASASLPLQKPRLPFSQSHSNAEELSTLHAGSSLLGKTLD